MVEDLERAERASSRCDVLLSVGSSLTVHRQRVSYRCLPEMGALVVIVNAETTHYDHLAAPGVRNPISHSSPRIVECVS